MADGSGIFFGTTRYGGARDSGTIFEVTPQAPPADTQQNYLLPLGEAEVKLDSGTVQLNQPLDLAQSDAARAQQPFALVYNSERVEDNLLTGAFPSTGFGAGWGLSGVDQLVSVPGGVTWVGGDGSTRTFNANGDGTFSNPPADFGTLVQNSDGSYTYTAKSGVQERFNAQGQETALVETAGPGWSFAYDGQGRLTQITASDGSVSTFTYGANGLLASLTEPGNRTVTFSYDGNGNLTGLTDANGATRSFAYADGNNLHLLTNDNWAPYNTTFTYDPNTGYLTNVALGSVQPYTITAAISSGANGAASVTDGRGNTTTYALDGDGRLLEMDQPGDVDQSWQYNASSNGPPDHNKVAESTVKTISVDCSSWPHLLKVKSKGAPIILVRGPKTDFFEVKPAGVLIHSPPAGTDKRANPETPIPGVTNVRERWMNTTYIESVVDGDIVDLNRIPLPADTPIIDERFKDGRNK